MAAPPTPLSLKKKKKGGVRLSPPHAPPLPCLGTTWGHGETCAPPLPPPPSPLPSPAPEKPSPSLSRGEEAGSVVFAVPGVRGGAIIARAMEGCRARGRVKEGRGGQGVEAACGCEERRESPRRAKRVGLSEKQRRTHTHAFSLVSPFCACSLFRQPHCAPALLRPALYRRPRWLDRPSASSPAARGREGHGSAASAGADTRERASACSSLFFINRRRASQFPVPRPAARPDRRPSPPALARAGDRARPPCGTTAG